MTVSFDYTTSKGEVIKVYGEVVPNRKGLGEDHITVKLEVPIVKPEQHRPQEYLVAPRSKVVSSLRDDDYRESPDDHYFVSFANN